MYEVPVEFCERQIHCKHPSTCKYSQINQALIYIFLPSTGCHCVWVYVCVSVCSAAVRRSTSTQSWPQAELSISLIKVQGYRWVTKPPLITNHFCHESQLRKKAAKSLHQTKKSDRTHTFVIQRCLWLGMSARFALCYFRLVNVLFNLIY